MIKVWTPTYFVRYIEFPMTVRGVTVPNNDGTFDIYINDLLCECSKEKCLAHEIRHIMQDHFYNDVAPIEELEKSADALAVGA